MFSYLPLEILHLHFLSQVEAAFSLSLSPKQFWVCTPCSLLLPPNHFLSCASLHLPLEPREVTSTPGAGATSMSGFPAGVSGLSFLKALRSCHTLQHWISIHFLSCLWSMWWCGDTMTCWVNINPCGKIGGQRLCKWDCFHWICYWAPLLSFPGVVHTLEMQW